MRVILSWYEKPTSRVGVHTHVLDALRAAGHEVVTFDHKGFTLPARLRMRVKRLHGWDAARLNRRLVSLVDTFRPELLLVLQGSTILPETVDAVRRRGVTTVNWFADYPYEFEHALTLAGHYDHFFVSCTEAMGRLHEAGFRHVRWLPFACSPAYHHPAALSEQDRARYASEIAFVGSLYNERAPYLAALAELGLGLWGPPGWSDAASREAVRAVRRGGYVTVQDWVKIYAACKVALNLCWGPLANSRVFEIAGCGAFQLVDARADVLALFKDGVELVTFADAADMVRKAQYYIAHEDERRQIAAAGRAAALARHTYAHRLAEMFEDAGAG